MQETEFPITPKSVERLRELVDPAPICMLASRLTEVPIHVCPMYVQEVDEEGNLWFFSGANSEHNTHLELDPRVQLIFSNPPADEFLTIYGEARVLRDRAKINELWKPMMKAWFPAGREDPELTLLQVQPRQAHCWNTREGSPVSTELMAAGRA